MERLTVRPKIQGGESFHSFLLRCSKLNNYPLLSLLNATRISKYNLHRGDFHKLDIYPSNIFNKELLRITGISENEVNLSSFTGVIDLFKGKSKVEDVRFIDGVVRDKLFYCPKCLAEGQFLKTIWKVRGIQVCIGHQLKLLNQCGNCQKEIMIKDLINVHECPYCFNPLNLCEAETAEPEELSQQEWWYRNWEYLIHTTSLSMSHSELALRLLYVVCNSAEIFSSKAVIIKHSLSVILLQCARGSTSKSTPNIDFVLNTLNKSKIEVSNFIQQSLPSTFINSVIKTSVQLTTPKCIAPWCAGFNTKETIIETATQSYEHAGKKLLSYFYCKECCCEFAFDKYKVIVERTYFIKIFRKLSLRTDYLKLTWPERELIFGVKRNRIERAIAYFHARGIFRYSMYTIKRDFLQKVVKAINEGAKVENIRRWEVWDCNNEHLIYRYHQEVMTALLKKNNISQKKVDSKFIRTLQEHCNQMINENIEIRLKNVAQRIGCSITTIHNKQGAHIVKEYCRKQKLMKITEST